MRKKCRYMLHNENIISVRTLTANHSPKPLHFLLNFHSASNQSFFTSSANITFFPTFLTFSTTSGFPTDPPSPTPALLLPTFTSGAVSAPLAAAALGLASTPLAAAVSLLCASISSASACYLQTDLVQGILNSRLSCMCSFRVRQ
jgi:hypothetical protein